MLLHSRTLSKSGELPLSIHFFARRRWQRTARLFSWIGCLLILTVCGCGPKSDRLPISGQVSLNGAPLDGGSIRFASVAGEKMFASGTFINSKGEFNIPQEKGLPPGTYRVEINSPDTKAPLVSVRLAPGEPVSPPTAPDRIPPDYNTESKHIVDVSASDKNHFNIDVVNPRLKK